MADPTLRDVLDALAQMRGEMATKSELAQMRGEMATKSETRTSPSSRRTSRP
jgi:hypothetical protein